MDGKRFAFTISSSFLPAIILIFAVLSLSKNLYAEDSACARVKIEVKQELTLERQAFDAHMRINNGLTHAALENIQVDVWFTDEAGDPVPASSDPGNTSALFYITVDDMSNIADVSGAGSVPAEASADIHWLVIPSPGSSNGMASGTLYNVGARLTYTVGGEESVIDVNPDYIFVKPMPELTLDYFLPAVVYGDDPFTQEIESGIPFTLGVRVKNSGEGTAKSLKIDSAQPKIVDNEKGLLINFQIRESEVNGITTPESLLADFGSIDAGASGVARWIMACTLSGKFVDFEATYSHADELGGELTSLITGANTHTLVRDVLVDLPGRDNIRDFLSGKNGVYKVYESDSTEADVTDQSGQASLVFEENAGGESHYTLTVPPTAGFMFGSLSDPNGGAKILKEVVRSDGRVITSENAWLSKIQDADTHLWDYFVNIFDTDSTGSYTLVFDAAASAPQKPVLQYIPDKSVIENHTVSFLVEASDPNGTVPYLSADPKPVGAQFTDNGDGTGIFKWTPQTGQQGQYFITFTASDGGLSADLQIRILVYDENDTDMDGMPDDWEILYFGNLSRDGTMDFDNDGVSDLQEFLDQTDPTLDEAAPSIPDPLYPYPNVAVADATPELIIENSDDPQNDAIDYTFEIYADSRMTDLVANQDDVAQAAQVNPPGIYQWVASVSSVFVPPPGVTTTNWEVPVDLSDNTRYYWRVRSSDIDGSSLWAYYDFFVNTQNDPPSDFQTAAPGDGIAVDTLTPVLSVMNAADPDFDAVTYTFDVYEDGSMSVLLASSGPVAGGGGITTSWTMGTSLADNTAYHWQATASDGNGGQTVTPLQSFVTNTANQAPPAPVIQSPDGSTEIDTQNTVLTIDNATDPDGDSLTYVFEADTSAVFDTSAKQVSGAVPEGSGATSFLISGLLENQTYYWRVKASDGQAESPWAQASFFVNRINDAPSVPTMKNPGDDAWVDTTTPVLSLHDAVDPDNDTLDYQFEVYSNQTLTHFVAQWEASTPDLTVPAALENNSPYFWRARAMDEHGVASDWSPVSRFFVKDGTVNVIPEIDIIVPFEDLIINADSFDIQWTDEDPDSSATISLFYDTDDQGEDGILIVKDLEEDPDGSQDTYSWDISGLSDGSYYIYAVIADQAVSDVRYAPAVITIDRTPPQVSVTPPQGSYESPQTVEMTTDEPGSIYYTLDGTDPTAGSIPYSDPIVIQETTILKCIAEDTAGNTSAVVTCTYQFDTGEITLNVVDQSGNPIEKAKVYLFKSSGSYYGLYDKTDSSGNAVFDPENVDDNTYRFRVDYLGHQFWTDPVALPAQMSTQLVIPFETVALTVLSANGPAAGQKVYLFSESGSYLGVYQTTDSQGLVAFLLPVGVSYKFRADVLGSKYWTDATQVQAGGTNSISLDTGGGVFTIRLEKDENTPIPGIKLYLFNDAGSYLGQYQKTDANGNVSFSVSQGDYKVRADYMGYKFWTGTVTVDDDTVTPLTLPHTDTTITVSGVFQATSNPITDVNVYLFNPSGSYLGQYQKTDAAGLVSFSLPDQPYKVRVDYMGQKFWSDPFTGEDTAVDIAMAKALVSVTGSGLPQPGIKVYLFSESGSYLSQYLQTDTNGQVMFTIPEGRYKFRADYESSKYWSNAAGLAADIINTVDVSVGGGQFAFLAQKATGIPITGIKTYVFTGNSSYIGLYGATDTNGRVFFDLADGTYLFRFDYMGHQFWSDPVTVPDQYSYDMTLPHEAVEVSVFTRHTPCENVKVYLFSETGSYLGQYLKTGTDGKVSFSLPTGISFKFRADVLGSQQWSSPVPITDTGTNLIDLDTGGGWLTVTLQKDDLAPIPDIKLYLFTENGSYTGRYEKTDPTGQVVFDVPQAGYKVRADYMGYKFWTDPVIITDDTAVALTLPHKDITITIQSSFQGSDDPVPGIKAYLFSDENSYMGSYKSTNTEGNVVFSLPDREYRIRADYMGSKFWTDSFTSADSTLAIPHGMARIHVTQASANLPDAKVYLFKANGSYLGTYLSTSQNGLAEFLVPAGHTYKLRVDADGQKYWTTEFDIDPDQVNTLTMEVN